MKWAQLGCVLALGLTAACGSSDDEGGKGAPSDGCTGAALEADLTRLPVSLPGSPEPITELPAEGYVVSTTYLRMLPGDAARNRFGGLVGAIQSDILARPGIVALELGVATGCNTARTKSIWKSNEAMYEFVTGEAHGAAVSAVGELSRGGSSVTSWTAKTLDETTWEEAAVRLGRDDGRPEY